jgi:hypothetical protein
MKSLLNKLRRLKMKRFLSILLAFAAIGLAAVPAEATLIDRGGGLIYDDDLNITWLQDANYAMTSGYDTDGLMTWSEAMTWADSLVYGGYSDWRLPAIDPPNLKFGYNGTDGYGYNISTGSEMGHLFYMELGNKAFYDVNGISNQPGWGLVSTAPFANLQPYFYWTSFEYDLYGSSSSFNFEEGGQYGAFKGDPGFYSIAVRTGDVAASVPEPGTLILMGPGIACLAFCRRKFKA